MRTIRAFGQQRSCSTAQLANYAAPLVNSAVERSWPNALRIWPTAQLYYAVGQLLRSWSTAARLDNFVIGAARLAKCADWSNAPYSILRNGRGHVVYGANQSDAFRTVRSAFNFLHSAIPHFTNTGLNIVHALATFVSWKQIISEFKTSRWCFKGPLSVRMPFTFHVAIVNITELVFLSRSY